jgi:hypothetical protein
MGYAHIAFQFQHLAAGKNITGQTIVFPQMQAGAFTGCDTSRILATMLEDS